MLIKYINLNKIYDSGQNFRWIKLENNNYLVPIKNGVFEITQQGENAKIISFKNIKENDILYYLNDDKNYKQIENEIKKIPKIEEIVEFSSGIRILNQDKLEMIITFILSANNNIKRIMKTVDLICKNYGKKIDFLASDGINYEIYSFPTLNHLIKITEENFKIYGAGYRALYLKETILKIYEQKEYLDLSELNDEEIIKKLCSLKGVGIKVAECISLFSYNRYEMFPVDIWIKKAIFELFFDEIEDEKIIKKANDNVKNINTKWFKYKINENFKSNKGLIQQYIYYYFRKK